MIIAIVLAIVVLILTLGIFEYTRLINFEKQLILKNFTENKNISCMDPDIILDKEKRTLVIDEDFLLDDIEVDLESSVLDSEGMIVNIVSDFLQREEDGSLKGSPNYNTMLTKMILKVFKKSGLRIKRKATYTYFGISSSSYSVVSSDCWFGVVKYMDKSVRYEYYSCSEKITRLFKKLIKSDGGAIVFIRNGNKLLGYIKYHRDIRPEAVRYLTRINNDYQINVVENIVDFINPSIYSKISDRITIIWDIDSIKDNPSFCQDSIFMISTSKMHLFSTIHNSKLITNEYIPYIINDDNKVYAIIHEDYSQDHNALSGLTDIIKARLMLERKNMAVSLNTVLVFCMIFVTLNLASFTFNTAQKCFVFFMAQISQLILTRLSFLESKIRIPKRNTKKIIYELVGFLALSILCTIFSVRLSIYYLVWSVFAGLITYTLSQNKLWIIIATVITSSTLILFTL